jgi:hypothetical protein
MDDMNKAPISEAQLKNLRFLRLLVTVLTGTMILGLLTIVALIVIRFSQDSAPLAFPASITLPNGTTATAFTQGPSWYAVVTTTDEILIFDRSTGALRQTIRVSK